MNGAEKWLDEVEIRQIEFYVYFRHGEEAGKPAPRK